MRISDFCTVIWAETFLGEFNEPKKENFSIKQMATWMASTRTVSKTLKLHEKTAFHRFSRRRAYNSI
jgi:hypothetical protein